MYRHFILAFVCGLIAVPAFAQSAASRNRSTSHPSLLLIDSSCWTKRSKILPRRNGQRLSRNSASFTANILRTPKSRNILPNLPLIQEGQS